MSTLNFCATFLRFFLSTVTFLIAFYGTTLLLSLLYALDSAPLGFWKGLNGATAVAKMAQTPSVGIRVLGALAGLVAGAVLGIIILIAFLLFARPDFGLNDVLIGGVIGEYIGLVIGYCYPERAGRMLGRMIEGI